MEEIKEVFMSKCNWYRRGDGEGVSEVESEEKRFPSRENNRCNDLGVEYESDRNRLEGVMCHCKNLLLFLWVRGRTIRRH